MKPVRIYGPDGKLVRIKARTAGWDASGTGRRVSGWNPTTESINSLIGSQLGDIRRRHRDQARKNPWLISAIESYVANGVGRGIVPLPKVEDPVLQEEIVDLFLEWSEECDADGCNDFYGLQEVAFRGTAEGGETFVRYRPRRASEGLAVPLQLQLLEGELCDETLTKQLPDRQIKAGIELNRRGKRWAYHMFPQHPGDIGPGIRNFGNNQHVRIRAEEILHVYRVMRPGQLRGIPLGAGVLARLYTGDKLDDAVLERHVNSSMFFGFYVRDGVSNARLYEDTGEYDDDGVEMPWMESGTIQELDPGAKVEMVDPPKDETFSDVERWHLRAVASGMGLTYEQLTGDYSEVNFTSARMALLEFRRSMEMIQRRVLIWKFCRPAWAKFIETAVMSGALSMSARTFEQNRRQMLRVKWIPQGWDFIDPEKEAKGARDIVRGGFKSLRDMAAAYGSVMEEVQRENAEDQNRAEELGLLYDTFPSQTTVSGQSQQMAAGNSAEEEETAPVEEMGAAS